MSHSGDDYKVKAVKLAISRVGDYGKYVRVTLEHDPAEMVCYQISGELPENVVTKLSSVIEREGNKLGIHVVQIS
ncbi:MAG TPA: hypothetical protein VF540_07670 [Segetibacter sp.]|jgi:hypothetical protein